MAAPDAWTAAGAAGPGVHYLNEGKVGLVGGGPGVPYLNGVSLFTSIEGYDSMPKSLFALSLASESTIWLSR